LGYVLLEKLIDSWGGFSLLTVFQSSEWLSDLPLNTFSPYFIKLEVQPECFLEVYEWKK